MLSTSNGGTPTIYGTGHARANLVWEPSAKRELLDRDWRGEALAYTVPDDMRIPEMVTSDSGTGPASRCTEALCQRIERLVLEGASVMAAKEACGIRRGLWLDWMAKADAGREPYRQFKDRMSLVKAWKEMAARRIISAASEHPDPGVATANAEKILKWENPEEYAPQTRQKTDITVNASLQVQAQAVVALASLPPDTVRLLAEALTARSLVEQTAPTPLLAVSDEG